MDHFPGAVWISFRALSTQGLVHARDEEEQPHLGVGEDVPERVDLVVAGAVGDEQGALVEHGHEAGRVAPGRGVLASVGAEGADHAEGRERDEVAGVAVDVVEHLLLRPRGRLPVGLAQFGLARDAHSLHLLGGAQRAVWHTPARETAS